MSKPKKRLSGFLLEIISIFLGVTIAFLANHLNEIRKDRIAEGKVLEEMRVELSSDRNDIMNNLNGHKQGLKAIDLFERFCLKEPVDMDSLGMYFERLYRDYVSISNTTAYESLKSRGLEIISNENLRTNIVQLYDFNYEILEKLEEQYFPAQFHENYFFKLTNHFKKYLEVKGRRVRVVRKYNQPVDAEIMMIFKEIDSWRNLLIDVYGQSLDQIGVLIKQIEDEIE